MIRGRLDKWLYGYGLRSTQGLALPDFLGIGAQKAGTTWLYENLRRHPELFLPETKELHYFDQQFARPLRSYCDYFHAAGDRKKGEITPAYGVLEPQRIRFIHQIMPEVRLIFIMRNPVERAWSQAIMNLVVQPQRNYEQVTAAEFMSHFRAERALIRGDYMRTMDNWLRFFDPEQLYVGFFEDISQRPTELLSEIFAHLGVLQPDNWQGFPYQQVFFPGPQHPLPGPYRAVLEEIYASQIAIVHERFGPRAERWLSTDPASAASLDRR
jgi:hypothetical protein